MTLRPIEEVVTGAVVEISHIVHQADGDDLDDITNVLRTTLTARDAEVRKEERERIADWVNKHHSRSAQPLYAHVDALDLLKVITASDTHLPPNPPTT